MIKVKNKTIIICGPTASGKTGFGVKIAKKFNGEIVSADSRQVYRGLNIGTGKDLDELKDIKYHLIDICNPEEKFTLFDWLRDARKVIDDVLRRGKTPIIVGGTGLYIQGLVEGFRLVNDKTRTENNGKKYTRVELNRMDLSKLQDIAHKISAGNSKLKNLDMDNPRRVIRFIERVQSGEVPTKRKPEYQFLQIAPDYERDELYRRIDKRVDERFEEGMLEEVSGLTSEGVDTDWLLGLGLEYRIITKYLIGQENRGIKKGKDYEDMKQELKYKIHQFAKRQLTWFRRFPEIHWVKNYQEAEKQVNEFLNIDIKSLKN